MKTLKGERYVVIKADNFTVFERFFVLSYISLHIGSTENVPAMGHFHFEYVVDCQ